MARQPQRQAKPEPLCVAVMRGCPFGSPGWSETTANRMGMQAGLRDPGRRRKQPDPDEARCTAAERTAFRFFPPHFVLLRSVSRTGGG